MRKRRKRERKEMKREGGLGEGGGQGIWRRGWWGVGKYRRQKLGVGEGGRKGGGCAEAGGFTGLSMLVGAETFTNFFSTAEYLKS